MRIDSLTFLFLVLPFSLLLCRLLPSRLRAYFLLALSGLLYWWAEGVNLALALGVVGFDYVMIRLLVRCLEFSALRRVVMLCSVVKSVGLIVLYGVLQQIYGVHFPLGLGVYCLISAGYVIDCYQEVASPAENPVHVALMSMFFPMLCAGPLVSANKLLPQLKTMRMSMHRLGRGAELFVQGLAKKIVLGDTIYTLYLQILEIPFYALTTLSAWMLVTTLALSTYYLLSGYCDMAKGLGLMFGFELPDNFNHPYVSLSINDFFTRFNITINKYIRRYVYINLGGTRGSVLSGSFNIFLVTALMGLWFGIRINVLLWAGYFAVFVILERYLLRRYLEHIPTLFRWLCSLAVILVSFVILAGDTPQMSWEYCRFLFGAQGTVAVDGTALYLLSSNYLVLALGGLCATNLLKTASDFFSRHVPIVCGSVSAVIHGIMLIVTVSFML